LNTFKNDLLKKKIPVIQARIKKDNYVVLNYIKSLGFKLIN